MMIGGSLYIVRKQPIGRGGRLVRTYTPVNRSAQTATSYIGAARKSHSKKGGSTVDDRTAQSVRQATTNTLKAISQALNMGSGKKRGGSVKFL